jgi:hypothetical protein
MPCAAVCVRAQLMMSQQTIFVDREDKNSGSKAADMIVRTPKLAALWRMAPLCGL